MKSLKNGELIEIKSENFNSLKVKLYANKKEIVIGDTLICGVVLQNETNEEKELKIEGIVSKDIKIIIGSVSLDGIKQDKLIKEGIDVFLEPRKETCITFKAMVTDNSEESAETVYTIYEGSERYKCSLILERKNFNNGVRAYSLEEKIISKEDGNLRITKVIENKNLLLNETTNCKIKIYNIGENPIENLKFREIISDGIILSKGSIELDNVILENFDLKNIQIGTILKGEEKVLSFDVVVSNIPKINPVDLITYYEFKDSFENIKRGEIKGDIVVGSIMPYISFTQVNSRSVASVEEEILLYAKIKNEGEIDVNNITLLENIKGGIFVENSLKIDNINMSDIDLKDGINLRGLKPDEEAVVSFKIKAKEEDRIDALGILEYDYNLDGQDIKMKSYSLPIESKIRAFSTGAILDMKKEVDKNAAVVLDTVAYKIIVRNIGDTLAKNIIVKDSAPDGMTLVLGTVSINGVLNSTLNIESGISINDLNVNEEAVIEFKAKILNLPSKNPAINIGNATFLYRIEGSTSDILGNAKSNAVETIIGPRDILTFLNKSVDKEYAKPLDTLTYKFNVENNSTLTAENVVIIDTIADGLAFNQYSVFVDGMNVSISNPKNGIQLGNLNPGEKREVIFKCVVDENIKLGTKVNNVGTLTYLFKVSPSSDYNIRSLISNTIGTTINSGKIKSSDFFKTISKNGASINDIIEYMFTIKNSGNVDVEELILKDILKEGTKFIGGSITINGNNISQTILESSINVGTIKPNEVAVVKFKVVVDKIPKENPVTNIGVISYSYRENPNSLNKTNEILESNKTFLNIVDVPIKTGENGFFKRVDLENATVSDILIYTLTTKNSSTVVAENVVLTDILDENLELIRGSVTIDGITIPVGDVKNGIKLGNIMPLEVKIVQFKTKVLRVPNGNFIENIGNLNYSYKLELNGESKNVNIPSDKTVTRINDANIQNEDGGFIKSVDKLYSDIGSTLTYNLFLKNTGNVIANNVVVLDTVPLNAEFIDGSVKVNGVSRPSENPEASINVGNLGPNEVATISFKVLVNTLPDNDNIDNEAIVYYNYTVNPNEPNGRTDENLSNKVRTSIRTAIIDKNAPGGFEKFTDLPFAIRGDIITYRILMKNTGNVDALDIIFKDEIKDGVEFVKDSLEIDGEVLLKADPNIGVTISKISPYESKVIKFKAKIINFPKKNPIVNVGNVKYSYISNILTGEKVFKESTTNEITTKVNEARIDRDLGDIKKSVDKEFAKINDILTYRIMIRNSGTVETVETLFFDTIPSFVNFIKDSFSIDGNIIKGANPEDGVKIGVIRHGETTVLEFKVMVTDVPIDNFVVNSSKVIYDYIVDPLNNIRKTGQTLSNSVETKINEGKLKGIKSADKKFYKRDDIISYKVDIKNVGNVDAINITFKDVINSSLEFVLGSLKVNGVVFNGNLDNGIFLGTLKKNEVLIVEYKAKVLNIPENKNIENVGIINYDYVVDEETGAINKREEKTNPVIVTINEGIISLKDGSFKKFVNKDFVDVNEEFEYKIFIKNIGNVECNNVVFKDILQGDLEFVKGSLYIDGALSEGSVEGGINLNKVLQGEEVDISFRVKAIKIPTDDKIVNEGNIVYDYILNEDTGERVFKDEDTNEVYTIVKDPLITIEKEVSKTFVGIGEVLEYDLIIKSNGNTDGINLEILDKLPNGTKFIEGSVYIDGENKPLENPENKIGIKNLKPKQEIKISYKCTVVSTGIGGELKNIATLSYSYLKNPSGEIIADKTIDSNEVVTKIKDADISYETGGFIKEVDKVYADRGDIVTYKFTLVNKGNTDANKIVLIDTIADVGDFIENTVEVDGVLVDGANPGNGIPIGTLKPLEKRIVTLKVIIKKALKANTLENKGIVNYYYTIDENKFNDGFKSNVSNKVITVINAAIISKEDGGFLKTVNKDYADVLEEITYTIKLENTGNVVAQNVFFKDVLKEGVEFIGGSVTVNGEINPSANIESGLKLLDIPNGEMTIISFKVRALETIKDFNVLNKGEVSYRYLVNPIEEKYKESTNFTNEVKTKINFALISNESGGFLKRVNKKYLDLNEVLVYTITIKNKGNIEALDVVFIDTVPKGTKFIEDSISVNGVVKRGENLETGISLENIKSLETVTIEFKVLAKSAEDIKEIKNTGFLKYAYIVNEEKPIKVKKESRTNEVISYLRHGEIGEFLKGTENKFVTLKEEITYTLRLKNTGNVDAFDVYVVDTAPKGTLYIDDSLKIDGKFILGENIQRGVKIDLIKAKEEKLIEFKVIVDTIPEKNPLENTAKVSYNYILNEDTLEKVYKEKDSNKVETKVNYVIIKEEYGTLIKSVNKEYADICEKIIYTITMKNIGNAEANNIVFTDSIPEGTKFVYGSLILNGDYIEKGNPENGIDVGNLKPNEEVKVVFEVVVCEIPKDKTLENKGRIVYRFTKDPKIPLGETFEEYTNEVKTIVNHGEITDGYKDTIGSEAKGGFTKICNKEYASISEILTYTFNIKNSGNTKISNVILEDKLAKELKFIEGSVTIDDVIDKEQSILNGIVINEIKPKESVKVTIKAKVMALPEDNIIRNNGLVKYSYKVDPQKQSIIKYAKSNECLVYVNTAIIKKEDGGFFKQVDKKFAKIGDIITYRIVLKNTGNTEALDVVFKDPIPFGCVFVLDSVILNEEILVDVYPQTGIEIGKIKQRETVFIEFKVKVVSLGKDGYVRNIGEVDYKYKVDPNKAEVVEESFTNVVVTKINSVDFRGENFLKTVSEKEVTIGDIVTYSFSIKNAGNITATNVVFKDKLLKEVQFIEGSFRINGNLVEEGNPEIGVSIASIKKDEIVLVSFDVLAIELPEKNPIQNVGKIIYEYGVDPNGGVLLEQSYSNEANLNIKKAILKISKNPKNFVSAIGEIVEYRVDIENIGNVKAYDVEIYDELATCLKFIEGTIKIGCLDSKDNIISGVFLGEIEPKENVTVIFKARAICRPDDGIVKNTVLGNYKYDISSEKEGILDSVKSNESIVVLENPEISIEKGANKEIAMYGDEISYKVIIENTGTIEAKNVKFFDILPKEMKLIGSMIIVNGKTINGVNPSLGINVGSLASRERIDISYKALIVKGCCNRLIRNKAYTKFIYVANKNSKPKEKCSNVAEHKLRGVSTAFSQISIDGILKIPCNMPKIEDVVNASAKVVITKNYVIDTVSGYSSENKRITGHKLVVNGNVFENLEFIALEPTQMTHYASNKEKFSTFIVLSEEYHAGSNIEIVSEVLDVYYEQIGEREVFVSATIMLDAIIDCPKN